MTDPARLDQHPNHPPEIYMNKVPVTSPPKTTQQRPANEQKEKGLKEKAESEEVAGRHRNSGQMDHKGAR